MCISDKPPKEITEETDPNLQVSAIYYEHCPNPKPKKYSLVLNLFSGRYFFFIEEHLNYYVGHHTA